MQQLRFAIVLAADAPRADFAKTENLSRITAFVRKSAVMRWSALALTFFACMVCFSKGAFAMQGQGRLDGSVSGESTTQVLRVDPRTIGQEGEGIYRTLHEAVAAAGEGDTLLLAPVMHDIEGRMLSINKSLNFMGESNVDGSPSLAQIVGIPDSEDETSLIFVRNSEQDINVSFSNLTIRASRIPDSYHDRPLDCLRVQGGRAGVRTMIDIDRVTLMHGSGGLCIEHYIFDNHSSDNDFVVRLRNSVVTDMFDNRNEAGMKETGHSQGVYHDGGTLIMENTLMRRIGWIPGSPIYRMSNKNQGLYAMRGTRRIIGCTAERVSHCGFSYRAGTTYSEGNTARLCPIGFLAGHREQPGLAVVVSVNDRVADAADFPDVTDGNPTLTCAFNIDSARSVFISNFDAWNVTGQGGWAAISLSRVEKTTIDIRGAKIEGFPGGGLRTREALDLGMHRIERLIITRDPEDLPAIIAPDLESTGFPLGGEWVGCKVINTGDAVRGTPN